MMLQDKTVLITGGGTGIGLGVADYFLKQGARVRIVGIVAEEIDAAVKQLASLGDIDGWQCDITDEEQVAATIAKVDDLDALIANAGSGMPGSTLQLTPDQWGYVTNLNITGTALCIKHAGLAMKARGGSIIAISSIAGKRPSMWMAPYSVSKAGVDMLVKTAAAELARFNIRVNCIAPGLIATDAVMNNLPQAFRDTTLSETIVGRYGTPEDIGYAAAFLTADGAGFITGQTLRVDGGCSLHTQDYEELTRLFYGSEAVDQVLDTSSGE